MSKTDTDTFQIGSLVTLKRPKCGTARIVNFLGDVEGGVVLDRRLEDFRCWNVKDLKLVKDSDDVH